MKHILLAIFALFLYIAGASENIFADEYTCSIEDAVWTSDLQDLSEALEKEGFTDKNLIAQKLATAIGIKSEDADLFKESLAKLDNDAIKSLINILSSENVDAYIKKVGELFKETIKSPQYSNLGRNKATILSDVLKNKIEQSIKEHEEKTIKIKKQLTAAQADLENIKRTKKSQTADLIKEAVIKGAGLFATQYSAHAQNQALRKQAEREKSLVRAAARDKIHHLVSKTLNNHDFFDPKELDSANISEIKHAHNELAKHRASLTEQLTNNMLERKRKISELSAGEEAVKNLRSNLVNELIQRENSLKKTISDLQRQIQHVENTGEDYKVGLMKASLESAEADLINFSAQKPQLQMEIERRVAEANANFANLPYEIMQIDVNDEALNTQVAYLDEQSDNLETWIIKKQNKAKRELRKRDEIKRLNEDDMQNPYARPSVVNGTRGSISPSRRPAARSSIR